MVESVPGGRTRFGPCTVTELFQDTRKTSARRVYKVLCALIALSGGLTKSVHMHEYATAFGFGHLKGHGCNQKHTRQR